MERYFKVSESELKELIHDSLKLCALKNGGVDNWPGYGDSIREWIEGFLEVEGIEDPEGLYNFYHAANKMIEDGNYPEVED